MKIFLSGPMTGIPEFNRPAFFEAEAALKAKGHQVWNPARLPDGLTHGLYIALNLAAMNTEKWDILAQLEGWIWSTGACDEYLEARKLGVLDMPIDQVYDI